MRYTVSVLFGEFGRFALVGAMNTVLGWSIIVLLSEVAGMNLYLANFLGYMVGLNVSLFLNRSFTFASSQTIQQSLSKFIVAFIACYGLNLIALNISVSILNINPMISQGVAITVYAVSFYGACKLFVFAKTRGPMPLGVETNRRVAGRPASGRSSGIGRKHGGSPG